MVAHCIYKSFEIQGILIFLTVYQMNFIFLHEIKYIDQNTYLNYTGKICFLSPQKIKILIN